MIWKTALATTARRERGSGRELPFTGCTPWPRGLDTPLRTFLRTETGSAAVLLMATAAAVVCTNVDAASYERGWRTKLALASGHAGLSHDFALLAEQRPDDLGLLRVGLEARREFDLGELRERRRLVMPLLAGVGGIVVPVGIFLAANAERALAREWGVAMSTDTAFALGVLAVGGPAFPSRFARSRSRSPSSQPPTRAACIRSRSSRQRGSLP